MLPLQDVIAVKPHGASVFPCLDLVDRVGGETSERAHVLIEAENYSALQLLRWLHRGKVDCIYIDPPYNTGARDWKYNNDYVDQNDSYRSSKWLSMMERRLEIARDLLKPDGILIVAIDDHEASRLTVLLERPGLFRGWSIKPIVVQHNPRGGGGDLVSNTHEYALFVAPPGRALFPVEEGADEIRDYRRRGRGENNFRYGRPNSFFAIHVDPATLEVKGVGPALGQAEDYERGPTPEGWLRIYPFTKKGAEERVWRNTRVAVEAGLIDGSLQLRCTPRHTIVQVIAAEKKKVPIRSVWTGPRYNAGERGTNLVFDLTGVQFPYPKSLYTVLDCLMAAIGDRKDALVLDFFAGSGTTAHALALMNALDNGARRSILVTNNELGPEDAEAARAAGAKPGDDTWESRGICRMVTYPRLKAALSGIRADGSASEIGYETGETEIVDAPVAISLLPFTTPELMRDAEARSRLGPLLGVTQTAMRHASTWLMTPAPAQMEGETDPKGRAILFDPERFDDFVVAMEEDGGHIPQVFAVPSATGAPARRLQAELADRLEPRRMWREITRPASLGLPGSLVYFRLRFLDPDGVEVGASFGDLIPALWMMSGAGGSLPAVSDGKSYLIADNAPFAAILDSSAFPEFCAKVEAADHVRWIFIVADSREAFLEMQELLPSRIVREQCVQLQKEYIDNFRVNGGLYAR